MVLDKDQQDQQHLDYGEEAYVGKASVFSFCLVMPYKLLLAARYRAMNLMPPVLFLLCASKPSAQHLS